MEEGGHYYTVYYTSLAVGFNEEVAYRHAVLSQMPDEVLWMDAAHMQTQQCLGRQETDFNNTRREVPAGERYRIQYGLHSLPGRRLNDRTKSSAHQRTMTTEKMMQESPVSLKFGLLLHRLGDTYAHSRIGRESVMYTVTETDECATAAGHYKESFGHLFDMHDPDYPFLRPGLFYSYLQNLYNILLAKAKEPAYARYTRGVREKPFHQVRGDFQFMFVRLANRAQREQKEMQERLDQAAAYSGHYVAAPAPNSERKAIWFIEEIRSSALRTMSIAMKKYAPEKEEGMSLVQFLNRHPELSDLNINSNNLTETINNMIPHNGNGGSSGKW